MQICMSIHWTTAPANQTVSLMSSTQRTRKKAVASPGLVYVASAKPKQRPMPSQRPRRTAGTMAKPRQIRGAVPTTPGDDGIRGAAEEGIEYTYSVVLPGSGPIKPPKPLPRKASGEIDLATQLVTEIASASPDVDLLCASYGLRREELSRLTGFSLRALADWSAGKLPSQPAQRRLREVRRLLDALSEIVKSSAIPGWMRHRNPAFDGLSPLQVIELGEIDRLWALVHERQ
jgi:hypothetical protein